MMWLTSKLVNGDKKENQELILVFFYYDFIKERDMNIGFFYIHCLIFKALTE